MNKISIEVKTENKIDIACDTFKKVHKSKITKFNKLDEWLEKESNFFDNEVKKTKIKYLRYIKGQIIKVDFGVNIGTELSHTHFAIVLNDDDTILTDNVTVLPLTSKNGYKRIYLGDLVSKKNTSSKYQNNSYGIVTQIKTISKKRILLNDKKYICDDKTMAKIKKAINEYIG